MAELARRAGTSAPALHRYESGWDRFEIATLKRIAAALGAHLEIRLLDDHPDKSLEVPSPEKLVRLLSPLFWEKSFSRSDLEDYPLWVAKRVIMFGNWRQVRALRSFINDESLLEAAQSRGVDPKTRNYWETLLGGGKNAPQGA